ncbi:hypothetical protein AAHE18_13G367500 [Arachis hypogaea]
MITVNNILKKKLSSCSLIILYFINHQPFPPLKTKLSPSWNREHTVSQISMLQLHFMLHQNYNAKASQLIKTMAFLCDQKEKSTQARNKSGVFTERSPSLLEVSLWSKLPIHTPIQRI